MMSSERGAVLGMTVNKRHPARYSVNRKLDFPELDVKPLLRAIGIYPRVLEQEEQPSLISASRPNPR